MRDQDERLPSRLGLRKQHVVGHGSRRYSGDAGDRLRHRLLRFLRSCAGRRWADVLPELDARLKASGEDRFHVEHVRRRIIEDLSSGREGWRLISIAGGRLRLDEDTGVLLWLPMDKRSRRRPGATFSAADLRPSPEIIR